MNKQYLKSTAVTVSLIAGSLISACAYSGGEYKRESPTQVIVAEDVKVLEPAVADALRFSEYGLAVVFAVDKKGNIQAFRTTDSKAATVREFPLPAGNIEQMGTITTFKTSNPKYCWLRHGALTCIEW